MKDLKERILEILNAHLFAIQNCNDDPIIITGKRNVISEIESLINENYYPKEFVEWINWEDDKDDFHFARDYTTNTWMNCDQKMKAYTTDELYQYWLDNIKDK